MRKKSQNAIFIMYNRQNSAMKFSYKKTSLVMEQELRQASQILRPEIERLGQAVKQGYETDYASCALPKDKKLLEKVQKTADEKMKLNPSTLVVAGIGGSNLGAVAVHEAINGRDYNLHSPKLKVYFADTVDSDSIYRIGILIENELKEGRNIILNLVTKSGTTTETIANFEYLFEIVKKHSKEPEKLVVAITDEGSKLWDF